MIHAPIYGSQFNPRAKLFKRFTPTETVTLNGTEITYDNNYYHTFRSIAWVEASDKQGDDEQLLEGLIAPSESMVIKYNGEFRPRNNSLEPSCGDLIKVYDEMWIIKDMQRIKNKSLINFATVYLSLQKIL